MSLFFPKYCRGEDQKNEVLRLTIDTWEGYWHPGEAEICHKRTNNPKTVVKNSYKGRDFWSSGRFYPRTAVHLLRSRLEEPCSRAGNHDWEMKQFRRGFAELGALGSQ